jgi:adenine-specific DNA methylase
LTDPPYGGLVQYFDLSLIWLNWLIKYDNKYQLNLHAEITIKKGIFDIEVYKNRFTTTLKNLYKLLKQNCKIVFTFYNKELKIWNAFLKSLTLAGFKIEKVIYQQNRRIGEAMLLILTGTSATDFIFVV